MKDMFDNVKKTQIRASGHKCWRFFVLCVIIYLFVLNLCSCNMDNSVILEETLPTQMTETSEPTKEPTEEPTERPLSSIAEEMVASLSLDEKIAQLFFLDFRTESSEEAFEILENHAIGGVILFAENINTFEQTREFVRELQSRSKIRLFIGIDEEGGRVVRTRALDVPAINSALQIGETGNPKNAGSSAETIASYISELGVNVDFAPVADVFTNPENTVIGDRAFSRDAETAAEFVIEFVEGLQSNGISACVKHFPGHGDTTVDSHYGIAAVDYTLEELTSREFVPFKKGIDAGVDFVMVGHISAPRVTGNNETAIFSDVIINILRQNLGFNGVIITDSLQMGAIDLSSGEAAVKAFDAGIDILLMPRDFEEAFNALKTAVETSVVSEQRLDESVKRIIELKIKRGLISY